MMREPERQCVACRKSTGKKDLIRLVRTPGGEIMIDIRKRCDGRGAYICPDEACIELARKKDTEETDKLYASELWNKDTTSMTDEERENHRVAV